jgi:SAM-dependent methyltransferase
MSALRRQFRGVLATWLGCRTSVASDKSWILSRVPPGRGRALDLGGGSGELCEPLRSRGYEYVNVDLNASGPGAIRADAHDLPFPEEYFELVVSSDSLEHFKDPLQAVREVHRVLTKDGRLVVWVPFMTPFHGDDFYRYSPLGLEYLMERADLELLSLETPLGIVTIIGTLATAVLQRLRLGFLEPMIRRAAAFLDQRLRRLQPGKAYAPFYLAVAIKRTPL